MADIAAILHWPPATMEAMRFVEILDWHGRAVDRWNTMHSGGEG